MVYETGIGDKFSDLTLGLIFAGGLLAIAVAAILFPIGRARPVSAVLYLAGFAALWASLYLLLTKTVTVRVSSGIAGMADNIIYHHRLGPTERYLIYLALVFLPIVAGRGLLLARDLAAGRRTGLAPGYLKAGLDHFHRGNYEAAIAEYTRAIEADPENALAFDRRGNAHLQRGDLVPALSDLNQSLALDPKSSDAYLHRGLVHMARGFADLAAVDFSTSLDFQPNVLEAHLNRGICRFKLGDYQGAAADFRLILHLTNHPEFAGPAREYLYQLGVPC